MKVNVEDISAVKKKMHVEIPKEDVIRELDKAYKNLKHNVKIKGFRPGKAPLSFLEKRFGKEIQAEVSGELIKNSYMEALGEAELKPVGEPTIDRQEMEKGKPYLYAVTVEVRPLLKDLNLKGLKLTKQVHLVDDEEVESHLKKLQKRSAQLKNVEEDRPGRDEDVVIIAYEGFKDGKALDAVRRTENFQVEIGSGRILRDFEKQLVGMRRNSTKAVDVRFPDDYYNKELAGSEVSFKVTLKEIKEEILPDLDDEFAKDMGEFESLDALRKAVRDNLESSYEAQSRRRLREEIMDRLIEQSGFDLPEGLVEEELASMTREGQNLIAQRGLSVNPSEEALREKYRPLAERKVREYLLMEKVIEQEGIDLTDEDLEKAYENFATALDQSVEEIKAYHKSSEEAFQIFRQKTLEKVVINRIIENSDVETVEVDNNKTLEEAAPS